MNRRFGWALLLSAVAAVPFVATAKSAAPESPAPEVAEPEFIGPPEIIHGKRWNTLSEAQ